MQTEKPIAIMIHDLNPWGGQDRSMLEIAWRLNKSFPLEIHSFSLEGYTDWPDMKHVQYHANIKKPILIKYLNYHFNSWQRLRHNQNQWIQSTGTASLKSNVVQVQFIHHAWQDVAKQLPEDKIRTPNPARRLYQDFLNAYKKQLEKSVYTPEKKYIAISHSIKKELMHYFSIPSENIEVIHHGVDCNYFSPWNQSSQGREQRQKIRNELNISEQDFVLLHVGALNARKGLLKSFEVMSFLKKQGFNHIKLLAVGQGDHKKLQQLYSQHDLDGRIIIAPHSKDIRNYYWASDCFFFPTYYEPFGLVILEAMASGLPVVTSHLAGGSELILDGSNGIIFDPHKRPKEIANQVARVFKDPSLRKQLGERARESALDHTWDRVGQEYQDFYKRISRDV